MDDKTPPGLGALCQMWQEGYSNHIWRVNAPNENPSLYPIWEPAASAPIVDGRQMQQIAAIVAAFSANQITREACERQLAMAGVPDEWIFDITQSTEDKRDELDGGSATAAAAGRDSAGRATAGGDRDGFHPDRRWKPSCSSRRILRSERSAAM
jgi:hypothetical protein